MVKTGRILGKKTVYRHKLVTLKELTIRSPDGKVRSYDTAELTKDSVAVVAVDKGNKVILIKEWRPTYDKVVLHIPAGTLNLKSTEKERRGQAKLELQQEAGVSCKRLSHLATTFQVGRASQTSYIYLATGLYRSRKPLDDGEATSVMRVPLGEAIKLMSGGAPTFTFAYLGLLLAERKLGLAGR
jgi:hypothetical protein